MKKTVCWIAVVSSMFSATAMADVAMTFDSPVTLSNTQAPGAWYTDRYAPSIFETASFDGDNRLRQGVNAAEYHGGTFYDTQGRKYDTDLTGAVQSFSIDLYVDDWGTAYRSAGLWATGEDSGGGVSAYPILAYRQTSDQAAGFYKWDYINGGYTFAAAANSEAWNKLGFVLTQGTGIEYFVNDVSVGTLADADTVSLANVILNVGNFGQTYDVYWDNFSAQVVPAPGAALLAMLGLSIVGWIKRKVA